MFYPAFVFVFLCLSMCLLATDLNGNLTRVVSLDKKELIEFSKSSASGYFNIARDGTFKQFGYYIWKKTYWSFINTLPEM